MAARRDYGGTDEGSWPGSGRGTEVRPWERLPKESPPAFEAFACYRDLGARRSFVAVARQVGKDESLIRRWADRHGWKERVWQYDLFSDREAQIGGERG